MVIFLLGFKCMCSEEELGRCILGLATVEATGNATFKYNIWSYDGGIIVTLFVLVISIFFQCLSDAYILEKSFNLAGKAITMKRHTNVPHVCLVRKQLFWLCFP